MAFVSALRDGETISHKDLMAPFGFKTERAYKSWIEDHDVPYVPVRTAHGGSPQKICGRQCDLPPKRTQIESRKTKSKKPR